MRKYECVVADRYGWVGDIDGELEHLRGHDARSDGCDECPESVVVVTGTALPAEGKLPGSWTVLDMLVEHDDLQSCDIPESIVCRCGSDGMGDDAADARRHVQRVHGWVRRNGNDYCTACAPSLAATPPVGGGQQ